MVMVTGSASIVGVRQRGAGSGAVDRAVLGTVAVVTAAAGTAGAAVDGGAPSSAPEQAPTSMHATTSEIPTRRTRTTIGGARR